MFGEFPIQMYLVNVYVRYNRTQRVHMDTVIDLLLSYYMDMMKLLLVLHIHIYMHTYSNVLHKWLMI